MSAYEKRQKMLALSQTMAQAGAGIGSYGPMGNFAGNMGQLAANMAQAEAESEAQKEAEAKENSGLLGSIGGLIGGVAGSAIGGPTLGGAIAGGALGSGLGSAAGQAVGGGGVDLSQTLGAGVSGGIGGYMGSKALGAAGAAGGASDAQLAVSSGNAPAYNGNAVADAAKAATVPSFGARALASAPGNLYAQGLLAQNSPAYTPSMGQQGYGWYGAQPYDPLQFLRPVR